MIPTPSKSRLALEFALGPRAATVVAAVDTLAGAASTVLTAVREEVAMRLDPERYELLDDAEACISWNRHLLERVAKLEADLAAEKKRATDAAAEAEAMRDAFADWRGMTGEEAALAADGRGLIERVVDILRRGESATLAPPPQAAPVPPVRAVLPGGVTYAMVNAYNQAWDAKWEATHDMDECKVAGLAAAIDAANIRVLGPGEGVVRVRTAKAGELLPKCPIAIRAEGGKHWELWCAVNGDEFAERSEYVLLSDLDAPKEAPDAK